MSAAQKLATIRRIIEQWRVKNPGCASMMSKEERAIYRLTKPAPRKRRGKR